MILSFNERGATNLETEVYFSQRYVNPSSKDLLFSHLETTLYRKE